MLLQEVVVLPHSSRVLYFLCVVLHVLTILHGFRSFISQVQHLDWHL